MQEKVGKVSLDYTFYPGKDLYSDGAIEDVLLDIARENTEDSLNRVIAEKKDWSILYHMSDIRENIVAALPITKDDTVLEIGAGCGAITGQLARMAGSVTCVDLSRQRSLINANRHKDYDNIEILVGNFQDIEQNLKKKFSCITLIGVFEYAQSYIGTEHPYEQFLKLIARHLLPGGRIVIAIENRLGLKYWAGCREDHTGNFFEGLENYDQDAYVRTFSRPELEEIFKRAGLAKAQFYYPYPDYKLPYSIYSDDCLPQPGSLSRNLFNFDRDRMVLFDESAVFDSLVAGGTFSLFSNSYLAIVGKEELPQPELLYTKFSTERDARFAIRTDIVQRGPEKCVIKRAAGPRAEDHIRQLAKSSKQLTELYKGTRIHVNRLIAEDASSVSFEYLSGQVNLESRLCELIKEGKRDEADEYVRSLCLLIREMAKDDFAVTKEFAEVFGEEAAKAYQEAVKAENVKCASITDLDMVAENFLLREDGDVDLIDYEWSYAFPVPVDFVIYRIWHYYIARCLKGHSEEPILDAEGFARERVYLFEKMEECWQGYVRGDRTALLDLYGVISPGAVNVKSELSLQENRREESFAGSLYYSEDGNFAEHNRVGCVTMMQPDGHFAATLRLEGLGNVKHLRWDPLEHRMCRITIEKVSSDALVELEPMNGVRQGGVDEFLTLDPGYVLKGDFSGIRVIRIEGTLEIIYLNNRLDQIDQTRRERDVYYQEMERLRAQIAAIHATKAYRAFEQLRRFRNFCAARIRGTKWFTDPDRGPKQYQEWLTEHTPSADTLLAQRRMSLTKNPCISILVPLYHTPNNYLRGMIESVRSQTYPNWQLCLADASVEMQDGELVRNEEVKRILEEYAANEPRIKVVYLDKNEGISGNTNQAAALADGDYIGLLDHDDLLSPDCLFEVAAAICRSDADVIYTDEDKINRLGTDHFAPNLKPDFAPDLLRSHNYITHFFVAKKTLFDEVGGFDSTYDGAQDYDLILKCTEKAAAVCHVPKILYHWRMAEGSTAADPASKMYAYEAGKKVLEAHLLRSGLKGSVEILPQWGLYHITYDVPADPLVSVIIPNKDHSNDLTRCIGSIMEKSSWKNLEIIVVENGSTEEKTQECYRTLCEKYPQVKVVTWDGGGIFNYSAINNFGVRASSGEYVLLLNNDTELIRPESIAEMVGIAARDDVGCVGSKLLYPDGTVQHGGIVLGFGPYGGFAGHVFTGIKKDDPGFMNRAVIVNNYSAVTAACLMVKREVFDQAGGLDESFRVALNDVDFCLRVKELGYLNVWTPFSLWYHHESASRGYEDTPEKQDRLKDEVMRFRSRYLELLDAKDPYYNPNFSLERAPFTLW